MVIRRVSNSGRKAKKVTANQQSFQDDNLQSDAWNEVEVAKSLERKLRKLKTRQARRVRAGAKGGNARAENFKTQKSKVLERAKKQWQNDPTLTISEVARRVKDDRKADTVRRWISPAKPKKK
jgi:hypothetical protein